MRELHFKICIFYALLNTGASESFIDIGARIFFYKHKTNAKVRAFNLLLHCGGLASFSRGSSSVISGTSGIFRLVVSSSSRCLGSLLRLVLGLCCCLFAEEGISGLLSSLLLGNVFFVSLGISDLFKLNDKLAVGCVREEINRDGTNRAKRLARALAMLTTAQINKVCQSQLGITGNVNKVGNLIADAKLTNDTLVKTGAGRVYNSNESSITSLNNVFARILKALGRGKVLRRRTVGNVVHAAKKIVDNVLDLGRYKGGVLNVIQLSVATSILNSILNHVDTNHVLCRPCHAHTNGTGTTANIENRRAVRVAFRCRGEVLSLSRNLLTRSVPSPLANLLKEGFCA
mmetsp:Transcript_16756/g.32615  ORF Transcript_16756/g.32615 Transcript_16756/m.32615 type:complete len:345 (-) Transcript_16756:1573-2607(-)